jgi:hypothetical protein
MVVRHGRVTDTNQPDLATLLRDLLQQQTAMLQVQAESVRLQRVLVERLLHVSGSPEVATESAAIVPAPSVSYVVAGAPPAGPPEAILEPTPGPLADKRESDLPFAPAAVAQNPARGARYYQSRPSPAARSIGPEELELLRRLREIRESSDLILQFGPHKGSTLAQVAMSNPEYIRQLMTRAQRPEVRAAAGRLVQALDAAAEHQPKPRGITRRGRPAR